ncbi:dihydrofolate reductase family protein [Luteococcus japonicus]|uniref:Dihydrofolate reductase n=1 Tax=Luteococcus japonicus LSP_Lj1 TaxID=1255658 RepID=A0A1R4IP70_9ACTN|nr:dihydrofolate reductase family protein [Luteococcus japonicus]SJN21444.1 Dihydrofolate reductase [Luteococcus japonicus LSP_Lj1]
MRNLVYYVATSIDGFIAEDDGDFSAFPQDPATLRVLFDRYPETCPVHVRDALGVTAAPRRFDAVVMGRRTHQPALDQGLTAGAYPHLAQYVVTRRSLPGSPSVQRVSEDPAQFVADLKREPGRDIWLCGGGDLAAQLLDLIDELQLKVNPVLLGNGIPLVRGTRIPASFRLVQSEQLPGGVLLNTYRKGCGVAGTGRG